MKRTLISLFACLSLMACSKSEDKAVTSTTGPNLNSPSGIMGVIDNAMSSMGGSQAASTGISGVTVLTEGTSSDPRCGEHGTPYANGTQMDFNDEDYASTKFYCLLSANLASPETVRGSLRQVKSVFCSVEAAVGTIEYTEAGNQMISSETLVPLTDACWPLGKPDGMTAVSISTLTATKLDSATTGWQYKLAFSGEGVGDYILYFFNNDGVIGFKKLDGGDAPGTGGATSITLDLNNGVLLLNAIDDRNGYGGADSQYRRLTRMRVTGTVSNYVFTEINKLEGYQFNNDGTLDPNSGALNNFSGQTVLGSAAAGYVYRNFQFDSTTDTRTDATNQACVGSTDSCASLTPLVATTNTFFNDTSTWAAFIANSKPLCDDGTSVTLSPTPVNGVLGVCQ